MLVKQNEIFTDNLFPPDTFVFTSITWFNRLVQLTSLYLITHFIKFNELKTDVNDELWLPVAACSFLIFLFPQVRLNRLWSKYLWGIITLSLGAYTCINWKISDNDDYLKSYWCLAIFLSYCQTDIERSYVLIRKNAQYLIGMMMLFAFVHKINSPEFLSGQYLHFCLTVNHIFQSALSFLQSFDGQDLSWAHLNYAQFDRLMNSFHQQVPIITGPVYLFLLSKILSWLVLLIEAIVAILHFFPTSIKTNKLRQIFIFLFVAVVYFPLPVASFAFIILLLGFAQTDHESKKFIPLYYLLFIYFFLLIP
jgi:hypothetical protein